MKKRDATPLKYIGLIIRLGMSMALPVVAGVLAGRYLDGRLGTGNVFLFIFIIIGTLTSFRNLYHQAYRITNRK
ncbi:MAG: AtpZ/AtpI family protein [Firmicutes bacterium]|nr:AtpZ/AtpI family protein [Bacillota bacterium]